MAEKHPKSKLKRYKSSVNDLQPVISSLKRSHTASFSGGINVTAETGRSAWWSSEQLPAEESLWALTLKSALPYLEDQHWDLVPDLPNLPAAKAPAIKLDEQWWCDLSEEVAPLPEPSPPSPRTSWNPDPVSLSSSQQELSVHTKPGPDPPARPLSSHSRQSPDGKAEPHQAFTKRPRPSLHSWEGPASSAAPSGVGGHKGGMGGEQEEETGPVSRRPLTNQVKASDSRVSLQREDEEEVHTSVRGGGGLQSCPMCLMVFPVGFTQLDCDGHLAQCLSEVNVDMTCVGPA
ncbi:uncharacterized protein si:ch73-70k4.1 [Cebidichthys violaceus]|uniref:uncharacterized protein si:ch73-70k4.1 n=1 Tax=Cebidichthys violaceus TaxID=271503 RepID=UPI0035CC7433